jgi:hypothetical protein
MRHTAVVLPLDLFERLQRDAESSGRGLSGEIRECLQRRADPETERFIAAVKKLGELVERDLGSGWHAHPYALAAFSAGIAALLTRYLLEGDERVRPGWVAGDPDDPPDTVGRTLARQVEIED